MFSISILSGRPLVIIEATRPKYKTNKTASLDILELHKSGTYRNIYICKCTARLINTAPTKDFKTETNSRKYKDKHNIT